MYRPIQAVVLVLFGMPATGQEIIQRMERDVVAATKLQPQLETAPLIELDELKQVALFRRFARNLRSEEIGILRRTALRLSQGDYAAAQKDWESLLGRMKEREFEPDVNALVRGVLQQAYLDKDLNFQPLAAAVQFREEQRDAAYQERTRLERLKADFDEGKGADNRLVRRLILAEKFAPGVRPVERAEAETVTADSVSEELQKIAVLCNVADANAKQAVADLQKALEGQILQTMSNVAKMLHDTAKPIIGNIKA
jgi:hypothetical protein